MMRIKTVTNAYDADEDRLRLAVVDESGHRRVLWITRRLAERLVPALLQGLPSVHLGDQVAEDPQEASAQAHAAQAYAQLEARLVQKPAQAVEVSPDVPHALVHQIELKAAQHGVRVLEFHSRQLPPCALWLTPHELRQWLGLLRKTFVAAQWRQDLWPGWVDAGLGSG